MNPEDIIGPIAEAAAPAVAEAHAVGEDSAMPGDSAEHAHEHGADGKKIKSRWKRDKTADHAEELARVKNEAEQARAALQDRLLRLQADFDNFRKRTQREKADWIRGANEDILSELLPVIDHLELALGATEGATAPDALTQGVRMVREQLLGALARFGLQPVDAGATFDPTRHEAISHLASATVSENGIIAQSRRGYQLGDRMLRPAQVVVSSGPAFAAGEG